MTPREKARDLYDKFSIHDFNEIRGWFLNEKETKEAAILCVSEILNSFNAFMDSRKEFRHELEIDVERYWQEVKKEIELL